MKSNTINLLNSVKKCREESALENFLIEPERLSNECEESRKEICEVPGCIEVIVPLLARDNPIIVESGSCVLRNISSYINSHSDSSQFRILRQEDCLKHLLKNLKSSNVEVVRNSCYTLLNLSVISEDQKTLLEHGAVAALGHLVNSENKDISMTSARALNNLLAYQISNKSRLTVQSTTPICESNGKGSNYKETFVDEVFDYSRGDREFYEQKGEVVVPCHHYSHINFPSRFPHNFDPGSNYNHLPTAPPEHSMYYIEDTADAKLKWDGMFQEHFNNGIGYQDTRDDFKITNYQPFDMESKSFICRKNLADETPEGPSVMSSLSKLTIETNDDNNERELDQFVTPNREMSTSCYDLFKARNEKSADFSHHMEFRNVSNMSGMQRDNGKLFSPVTKKLMQFEHPSILQTSTPLNKLQLNTSIDGYDCERFGEKKVDDEDSSSISFESEGDGETSLSIEDCIKAGIPKPQEKINCTNRQSENISQNKGTDFPLEGSCLSEDNMETNVTVIYKGQSKISGFEGNGDAIATDKTSSADKSPLVNPNEVQNNTPIIDNSNIPSINTMAASKKRKKKIHFMARLKDIFKRK